MHRVAAEVVNARLGEVRAASTAGGGSALTTAASLTSIPFGSDWISITPRNFAGAAVARFVLNPYLCIVTTTSLLTGGSGIGGTGITAFTNCDISKEMQDGDATNFAIDSIPTFANGGAIYVGAHIPFRGAAVDIGTDANATPSELTVKYWNGGWADITDTDGTETGGNTSMAIDGNVTWTVPTTWTKTSLQKAGDTLLSPSWAKMDLYWTRWEWAAALDSCDIIQLRALNRSTAYAELLEGQPFEQAIVSEGPGGVACVEALTDVGTANLVINVATARGQDFV